MDTTRSLPCRLTDEERRQRSDALVAALVEDERVREASKAAAAEAREERRRLRERVAELRGVLRYGEEWRDVAVTVEVAVGVDGATATVTRQDTGEVVETRPATAEERQLTFAEAQTREPEVTPRRRGRPAVVRAVVGEDGGGS